MITQPYTRLALSSDGSEPADERSPASLLGTANAVQLTVVVYQIHGIAKLRVQVSNDAENWTDHSENELRIDEPGFFVMEAETMVCTRYSRVRLWLDAGQVILAVTQQTMEL